MKKPILAPARLAGFLAIALMISCETEETDAVETTQEEVITTAELQFSDESELISEEVVQIAEDVYLQDEIALMAKSAYNSDYLPECVTITTVVTDLTREKTIDFGGGCELPNGNVLAGIITMSYAKDPELAQKTISLNLTDFSFNGVGVQGSASILRQRSNESGNPQSTVNANYTISWPSGESASFSGNRTREWVEGVGTGFWGDNVILIEGSATYTGRAGNTYTKEITQTLRRELSCRFIVSGVVTVSRNANSVSLDFGDGSCDAKGIFTNAEGESQEVFLRRFGK